jgi:dTDP-4-amino-4,6-dideoxygalactose transaminase
VTQVLESGNLVQGSLVDEFESALCDFTGLSNCAVVSSGTAALHLALLALGIGPGDYVVVPAFTFPASANAVLFTGAKVIFCDVEKDSYVVSADVIERVLKSNQDKNVRAVMVVHEFGCPADMSAIRALADQYELRVIEDAACALGSYSARDHVGSLGDVACFSFHPRKAITTGEGGAVMSADPDLVARVKTLRNHGMEKKASAVEFVSCGLNYRLTDIQAALGLGQLARFREELNKRGELACRYQELLDDNDLFALPKMVDGHSWQSYMVVLKEQISRDDVIARMIESAVRVNIGAQALPLLLCYQGMSDHNDYPHAVSLYQSGLVLPIYGKLDFSDLEKIVGSFMKAIYDN